MDTSKRQLLKSLAAAPALAAPALLLNASTAAAQSAPADTQNSGVYRFPIGDIEVIALLDGYHRMPTAIVPNFDAEIAEKVSRQYYKPFSPHQFTFSINAYLVRNENNLVLIDAGAPALMGPTIGKLVSQLAAAGVAPTDIDTILLTHLHADHIGAILDSQGNKVFPNAKFVCSEAEWEFTHDDAFMASLPTDFQGAVRLSRQLIAPYENQLEMFTGERDILPGIRSLPIPGHTPGHTAFIIESGDDSLLLWGDLTFLGGLQFANPDWSAIFDFDPAAAVETRRAVMDRASADRMMVGGMHIDFPGIGYVERTDDAYRFITAPWVPGV